MFVRLVICELNIDAIIVFEVFYTEVPSIFILGYPSHRHTNSISNIFVSAFIEESGVELSMHDEVERNLLTIWDRNTVSDFELDLQTIVHWNDTNITFKHGNAGITNLISHGF